MEFLKNIDKRHWIDALWWLFSSSVGALMPIWGLWFFLRIFQQTITIEIFTQNGEFALYSASLVSTSFYLITKDYVPARLRNFFTSDAPSVFKSAFPAQNFFSSISVTILLLSTLLFASTTFWHLPGVSLDLDLDLVNGLSVGLFVITTIISYVITAIDNSASGQSEEDYRKVLRQNQDELANNFDALDEE